MQQVGSTWLQGSQAKKVFDYIEDYWEKLVRFHPKDTRTLIGLPNPYLVPGDGEMFQEQYYWDSYFMSLGLIGTARKQMIVDMTRNLLELYRRFGVIPNANRYYFLSRSQPPFLTAMIWLSYQVIASSDPKAAADFLSESMSVAEDEHINVWLGEHQPHKRLMRCGLSRYFDANYLSDLAACESGWDHSTRCEDRWLAYLPVDLNSILYARELDFARAARLLGNETKAIRWQAKAFERSQKIVELMWDSEQELFFDCHAETLQKLVHPTLAGFFPMWAGLATAEQARRMVTRWLPLFEKTGGLVTSLEAKEGRQWAYPNGWAPLQWLVAEGLDKYNFHEEAARVRLRWCLNCLDTFNETGALWEKYNVVDPGNLPEAGLYGSVKGFGWTNSVFVDFARKLDQRAQSLAQAGEARPAAPLVVQLSSGAEVSSLPSH